MRALHSKDVRCMDDNVASLLATRDVSRVPDVDQGLSITAIYNIFTHVYIHVCIYTLGYDGDPPCIFIPLYSEWSPKSLNHQPTVVPHMETTGQLQHYSINQWLGAHVGRGLVLGFNV